MPLIVARVDICRVPGVDLGRARETRRNHASSLHFEALVRGEFAFHCRFAFGGLLRGHFFLGGVLKARNTLHALPFGITIEPKWQCIECLRICPFVIDTLYNEFAIDTLYNEFMIDTLYNEFEPRTLEGLS